MDNLLCAILVYLPADGFQEEKNLKGFCEYVQQYKKKESTGSMAAIAYRILKKISGSVRYRDMIFSDFRNEVNNKTQFGAMTVRLGKITVIVYKGTDHSAIGWMENFRISYEYPTYTHRLAIQYLQDNISPFRDREIYVAGHSKGGNLAMVSAMEAGARIFRNIKKVYNFDGPGLRKEEFCQDKYKKLEKKLMNVVPEGSIVGVLLYNKNYTVVETAPASLNDHFPDTWRVFGEFFVQGTFSGLSLKIHDNTTKGVEDLTYDQAETVFETIFHNIRSDDLSNLDFSPETILSFLKNMKDVDEKITGHIYEILKKLLW